MPKSTAALGEGSSDANLVAWNEASTDNPTAPPSDWRNCISPPASPTSAVFTWFWAARRKTGKVRPIPKPRGINERMIPPTGMTLNMNFHNGVAVESCVRPAMPTPPMMSPSTVTTR